MKKLLLLILLPALLSAQDNHYNTQQFGARASLLGGAVVGGIEDNSAMYYNPAAYVFLEEKTVSLNTTVYRAEFMTLKNGLGTDQKSASKRIITFPQALSSLLTHNAEKKYRFGFIAITRHHAHSDYSQRVSYFSDFIPGIAGEELFTGQLDLQNNVTEYWAGLCGSFKLSEKFSLGFTPFLSYRNQRYLYSLSSILSSADSISGQDLAHQRYMDAMRQNTIRFFLKAGIHYRHKGWHFGLTITSPSIGIWGEARTDRNITFFGIGSNPDVIYDDRQWFIKGRSKQPISVAIGLLKKTKNFSIAFSAEYFAAVKEYNMAEGELREVARPLYLNNGPIDFVGFKTSADQVLNLALGAEFKLSEKLQLHSSLCTDFATQNERNVINIDNFSGPRLANPLSDLYHASLGLSMKKRQAIMTVGTTYTFGKANNVMQQANFTAASYPNHLWGDASPTATLIQHTITLVLGYTYYFDLMD
jgi:hypothetical protein